MKLRGVALAAMTPANRLIVVMGGRLGDLLGLRRVLLAGAVIFVVSSTLVGFAQDVVWAIAARALQGTGAALMMPTAGTITFGLGVGLTVLGLIQGNGNNWDNIEVVIALLGALVCFVLVRKGDPTRVGPVFTRRSRWIHATTGRSSAVAKRSPITSQEY